MKVKNKTLKYHLDNELHQNLFKQFLTHNKQSSEVVKTWSKVIVCK